MNNLEIISAPSILGLRPSGVQHLAQSMLAAGLEGALQTANPVRYLPTLNTLYSDKRDRETHCLNVKAIANFSQLLASAVSDSLLKKRFPVVLGGDCSILVGIMPAMKAQGAFGLIFCDAHADFYDPEKSLTGEVADMDLAIVTGRGPEVLTNINNQWPYVKDEHVIHIGQRDEEEARTYGAQDICTTSINCIPLADIEQKGMEAAIVETLQVANSLNVDGFWLHYDTDVLSDDVNPAVDYRLPGGLQFEQMEALIRSVFLAKKLAGISITIYNPVKDESGQVAQNLTQSLGRALKTAV